MEGKIVKLNGWQRRKARVRKKVSGTPERPRLNVYRSNKHIYAQIIDDTVGKTIVAIATNAKEFDSSLKKSDAAKKAGELIAKLAIGKGVEKVVFDRSGNIYHGRIKALAEGAREAGLKF